MPGPGPLGGGFSRTVLFCRENGWRAFRVEGVLEFSLVGVLAGITTVLAAHQIGIFAVSTYRTDYLLTKEENYENALTALEQAGYEIVR